MARQRFIWPDFWKDPQLGRADRDVRLFFIGAFSNADDEGRLVGDPSYLRSEIFPYDDLTLEQMTAIRDRALACCDNLILYEQAGKTVLAFLKWGDWQRPKYPRPSKLPAPVSRGGRPKTSGNPPETPPKPPENLGLTSGETSTSKTEQTASSQGKASPNLPPGFPEPSPRVPPQGGVGLGEELKTLGRTSTSDAAREPDATNGLPVANQFEITNILAAIGADADEHTPQVISSLAERLPDGALAKVAESVRSRHGIRDRAEYAVKALKGEIRERGLENERERSQRLIDQHRANPEAWVRERAHALPPETLEEWLGKLVDDPDERARLAELAAEIRNGATAADDEPEPAVGPAKPASA